MASNLLTRDGLQPNSDGLHPSSGAQIAMTSNLLAIAIPPYRTADASLGLLLPICQVGETKTRGWKELGAHTTTGVFIMVLRRISNTQLLLAMQLLAALLVAAEAGL